MDKFEGIARKMSMRPLDAGYAPDESFWSKLKSVRLPPDYMEFLQEFPTTQVFEKDVCFPVNAPTAEDGTESLDVLFAASKSPQNDLVAVNAGNELGRSRLFIIGEASTNPLCVDLKSGEIKLWDRATPGGLDKNLYTVAKSFFAFFSSLAACKEKMDDRRKVVSVTLSDEIRAKAAEYLKRNQ